jgi:predicted phage tail protein
VADSRHNSSTGWAALTGIGAVAVAIGCCAAVPLAVALAGGIAVGTLLGVGASLLALIGVAALITIRARRRAACETPQPPPGPDYPANR